MPRIIEAATVVPVRDGGRGLEVLMVERHPALTSHGGHWAFPGGAVDSADHEADTDAATGAELVAARRAAVRETAEEVGLEVQSASLVAVSHWTTPPGAAREYRTWFFVAPIGAEAVVRPAVAEVTAHRWQAPEAALEQRRLGDLVMPVPQFVTLVQICGFDRVEDLVAELRAREPQRFHGRRADVAGGVCWIYEGDEAWDHGELDRPGPRRRMWAIEAGWRFEAT